ncbi:MULTISPECIES: hypothetical protein [Enterococcus]|jgi:hypothetical protein|uniref:hypothetical protein n=1 Tax=Enterococcus TaxID=1350 RepID=UPI001AD630DB|nr:hypothetical protein [Enterococcus casseliflavus]MBO6358911.1 hypothetical protein [Enterococcus casseliflavus]MBO6377372.1 hypothetical protein [Enterococcus casseliflavus]MDV7690038.1 hypothetical protein [Enterococcus casseliflavus]MEB8418142.1 hypothetical protein [Enterococcus casseliflavus]
MKDKNLLVCSQNLASRVNDLKIIERLIENIEYSRVTEDTFNLNKHLGTGALGEIGEALENIREQIQAVSDALYPKSGGSI